MPSLRLGTRKSALAQAQARWVAGRLEAISPDLHVELVLITTTGDQPSPRHDVSRGPAPNQDWIPAYDRRDDVRGGLKTLFTKEIEEALLDHRIDLAVHSLKDMAATPPTGLVIGAVPPREDPHDVWIAKNGLPFKDLPAGARIGTGAVRRQAQLRHHRKDLEIVPLRGNVDTRLRKLREENLDGIILALAGLRRLGREAEATEVLSAELMLPAVGQGCLAIESRLGDAVVQPYLAALDHLPSHQAALAERAFLQALGGSCQTPIAAFADASAGNLEMIGLVASTDGTAVLRDRDSGAVRDAEEIGDRLAKKLLKAGADQLLAKSL